MARLSGLYALTPDLADTAELLRRARAALLGGARLLQYRNKGADGAQRREQAGALLGLCREFGAPLIVNDDLGLALEIGADGAHLGREDGDLAAARAALGPGRLLGVSCYDAMERAREAKRNGADYVAFGSFFASPTKPAAVRAPLALPAQARAELGLPVCAIGGITLQNAPQLLAAGVDLLAVITDLFEAPDIRARAAAFTSLFQERVTS
ncbi:MAG: thiamine phosphate synthase [Rhodocyclaceae bacterium]|jgi:thiamine-phosphate pyrophosphorylase|nr:thiamine phosphate synthase [Rhodocyclaceae bacterium]